MLSLLTWRLALAGTGPWPGAQAEAVPVACSCEEGGEHWRRFREAAWAAFTPDFPARILNPRDPLRRWLLAFPCPDLTGRRHRGMWSLSDCAPGVIMLHVACAQRLLLQLRFTDAQEQLVEALQALPFAEGCLSAVNTSERWPVTALDVHTNYVRLYRALSYYEESPELIHDLAWRPSRDCVTDADCGPAGDKVCVSHRCVAALGDCKAAECPAGARCTSVHSPDGSPCSLVLGPICVVNGELEAYHPASACLPSSYPRMIKACSEMGTTLYPLHWSSVPYEERVQAALEDGEARGGQEALVLPVTLRLQSPWHMLHSLVPAYGQALDERYGLLGTHDRLDVLLVDQDLDKDRHIWGQVFPVDRTEIGPFAFLLGLLSSRRYELIADIQGPRCYNHVVWGHELMLYSGGGWVNYTHIRAFAWAAQVLTIGGTPWDDLAEPRLLLIERRNATAWGRWIDNFGELHATATRWATQHPELLAEVHVADLAELKVHEQLRLVTRMRIVFGAHGDGLSWAAFVREGGALLEALPKRNGGFQACLEGVGENPWGIFGGLARLARLTHICFLNAQSEVRPMALDAIDVFQWNWRQLNIHIDLWKFEFYLSDAARRVRAADTGDTAEAAVA